MTKGTEKLILALAFGLLETVCLLAQENSSCLRRSLNVSVINDGLQSFVGLTAANFRGTFQGKPVQILSAKPDARPRRVVILLDMSGSMIEPAERLLRARGLALSLIAHAPNNSPVGVVTFSKGILEQMGFAHSREELTDFVAKTHAAPQGKGQTALRDAILEALHMLGQPGPHDVIYVVTDGIDNASKASVKQLKPDLLAADARIYAIILPDELSLLRKGYYQTSEVDIALGELREIVDATGGTLVYYHENFERSRNGGQAREWFVGNLVASVRESYHLEVELPQAPQKRQRWKLDVIDLPKHKGSVHVLYPHDLLPCAEVTPRN
jgi:Mg-chelatase subunit ChlD